MRAARLFNSATWASARAPAAAALASALTARTSAAADPEAAERVRAGAVRVGVGASAFPHPEVRDPSAVFSSVNGLVLSPSVDGSLGGSCSPCPPALRSWRSPPVWGSREANTLSPYQSRSPAGHGRGRSSATGRRLAGSVSRGRNYMPELQQSQ